MKEVTIMPNEYWVPIEGYEGWYEVSDQGRVRSVDRVVTFKNGKGSRFYKGQILKFRYHNGYAMVNLNKNKKMREHYVHRLVIENFTLHPNIGNGLIIRMVIRRIIDFLILSGAHRKKTMIMLSNMICVITISPVYYELTIPRRNKLLLFDMAKLLILNQVLLTWPSI